jgi:hypothetical protein
VPPAIPVAVAATTPRAAAPAAAALPSAAAPAALLGAITTLAVNRTVPTRFKGHGRGLSAAGADHGCARTRATARTGAISATATLGMGRSVATAASTLLGLAAWFAASGRGVTALLEELLFTCGENKFLPAVATCK